MTSKAYQQIELTATNTNEYFRMSARGEIPKAGFLVPKSAERFGTLLNTSHLDCSERYADEIEKEYRLLLTINHVSESMYE